MVKKKYGREKLSSLHAHTLSSTGHSLIIVPHWENDESFPGYVPIQNLRITDTIKRQIVICTYRVQEVTVVQMVWRSNNVGRGARKEGVGLDATAFIKKKYYR